MLTLAPPFSFATATAKVRAAEDLWNSRDPERVALAYSLDAEWRNRERFLRGRAQIRDFLADKWRRELDYRLVKSLWSFGEHRIAVRFQYEFHDDQERWFRAYGNELWEFDNEGLMSRREASINDCSIGVSERKFHWPAPGPRPADDAGIEAIR